MSFQEYAYQTGTLLSQLLAGNGTVPDANSAMTRIEQKLDAAIAASNSTAAASAVTNYQVVVTADVSVETLNNLRGMDCNTGKMISGIEYLSQRIVDALTTAKGSQVLLRARGSDYPDKLDAPMNQRNALSIVSAAAALFRDPLCGVPDFSLTRVVMNRNADEAGNDELGSYIMTLFGEWLGNSVEINV